MLGIQDSEFRVRDRKIQAWGVGRDAEKRRWENQFAPMLLASADWNQSVANPDRQQGVMKSFTTFEKDLQELNPAITIKPHPWNDTKSVVYCGNEEIIVGEKMMPEFSVMSIKEEEEPIIYDGVISLDAPATRKRKKYWNEVSRGWRRILVTLIMKGIISLGQAEKKFGPVDRATWARLLGKQKIEGSLF